jgi:hypothetical protein
LARAAVASVAGLLALGLTATPVLADANVGADAGITLGGYSLDAGFEQTLQSVLDSQFVGVEVAIVHGHLVLSGYASPGVHTAVLAIVSELLQNPVAVPVELDIITPSLGQALPFLDAGADVELPDLSGLLNLVGLFGVVDKLQIAR